MFKGDHQNKVLPIIVFNILLFKANNWLR